MHLVKRNARLIRSEEFSGAQVSYLTKLTTKAQCAKPTDRTPRKAAAQKRKIGSGRILDITFFKVSNTMHSSRSNLMIFPLIVGA